MNDSTEPSQAEHDKPTATQRSWLERLSHVFMREPHNIEELIELLREAQANHVIGADALSMIESVLQVSKMQVRDIMIPRAQMVVVEQTALPKDFLPTIIESKHSRFPVIGENRDKIIGILLAKDLLETEIHDDKTTFDIHRLVRPAVFIPESKRLDILLKEFRDNHNHMAIVVDEYGGVAGLVTIEDVLEQIVGDIEDETDIDEKDFIKPHSDGFFIIKAHTPIEDFNKFFETDFSDEEYDTIGGLVVHAFERLPKRGETTLVGNFEFKILHADNRRVRLLQARKIRVSDSEQ